MPKQFLSKYAQNCLIFACLSIALSVLSGCQPTDRAAQSVEAITTEVFYRERMLLPPGAELTVRLEDVSKQDTVAKIISEQTQVIQGAPPYRVSLSYNPEMINERSTYALRASIKHQGKLLFINQQHIPAFPDQSTGIRQILVQSAGRQVQTMAPRVDRIDGNWHIQELNGANAAQWGSNKLPTLTINGTNLSGFAGCNRYQGQLQKNQQTLTFGPMAITEMYCSGVAQKIEDHYIKALSNVDSFKANRTTLKFIDDNGQLLMVFTRL